MTLKGLFLISRPINSFLSGFAVVIGAIAAISSPLTGRQVIGITFGYFATSLIAVGGYAINDVFDVDIDKINAPHRPIPSGLLTLNQARAYSIILFIIGVCLAFLIDIPAFFIAFTGGILLYLYAAYFKRSGFIGNLMIGLLTSIPFIFGGFLTYSYETMIYPAIFAFLIIVGREVIKDIEDVYGDRIEDVRSIALHYGVKPARTIGLLILFLLIVLSPLPILLGYYKSPIFFGLVIIIDIVILFVGYLLVNRSEEEIIVNSTRGKKLLKVCITLGIIAFLFEGLVKLIESLG
ncbi:MAG: geranylgeranylglycerol-phosphate geranylgeranyltransferase [Candidatus Hodarchaeota archaeon]